MKEYCIENISCKHYFMIGVELKYLIESGYLRIFDRVCQAIQKLEAMGCQPIKLHLRGTYCKSTNDNASSRQTMCIYILDTIYNMAWKVVTDTKEVAELTHELDSYTNFHSPRFCHRYSQSMAFHRLPPSSRLSCIE